MHNDRQAVELSSWVELLYIRQQIQSLSWRPGHKCQSVIGTTEYFKPT